MLSVREQGTTAVGITLSFMVMTAFGALIAFLLV
jgi:hypothetical protein